MSFPLDPANTGYTKVNDLAYDSKLIAGLQQQGVLTPGFAAIKGRLLLNGVTVPSVVPIIDTNTNQPIMFDKGDHLLSLRGSLVAPSIIASTGTIGLSFNSPSGTQSRPLTNASSGTNNLTAAIDLIPFGATGGVSMYCESGPFYLTARIDGAPTTLTQGQFDVSVLKL